MSSETFKFGNIVVHVFPFHLEALLQGCLGAFLLEGVCEVSAEGPFHSCPQPDIGKGHPICSDFIDKPAVLGLYPFIDMWPLEICEE